MKLHVIRAFAAARDIEDASEVSEGLGGGSAHGRSDLPGAETFYEARVCD